MLKIGSLLGDDIGLEVVPEAVKVMKAAAEMSLRVDPGQTGNRGPVVARMRTKTHGESSCRVKDVRGGADEPFTPAEIDGKFDECFRRGVRPLDAERIGVLMKRVREVETLPDMAASFDGICRD